MVSWWMYGLALVIAIGVASVVLVVRGLRVREPREAPARTSERAVRWAIGVGTVYAIAVGAGTLLQSIGIATGALPVDVATVPYWPATPPDVHIGGVAEVLSGGFTHAAVVAPEVGAGARAGQIVGVLLSSTVHVAAAVIVVRFCRRLRDGAGIRGTAREFGTLAAIVLVAGFGGQIAASVGMMAAARDILPFGINEAVPGLNWPVPASTLMIDLWPVFPALALAALAAAFRHAEGLQRDTEGLV